MPIAVAWRWHDDGRGWLCPGDAPPRSRAISSFTETRFTYTYGEWVIGCPSAAQPTMAPAG